MTRSSINPDPSCGQIEGIHPDRDGLTIILRTNYQKYVDLTMYARQQICILVGSETNN